MHTHIIIALRCTWYGSEEFTKDSIVSPIQYVHIEELKEDNGSNLPDPNGYLIQSEL